VGKERTLRVLVEVETENDGWTYLRNGPQTTREALSLEEALTRFSARDWIIPMLEQALAKARASLAKPGAPE
jgi:hypothetical protein